MPPRKQISKEQIVLKAYEIVQKNGTEELTARNLAKELNCSTQPIYLTFSDMKELKGSIADMAFENILQYVERYKAQDYDPFLAGILGYVQFANEERNLYRLIYLTGKFDPEQVAKYESGQDACELNMMVYAHGIIMMKSFGTLTIGWEQIRKLLVNTYDRFKNA